MTTTELVLDRPAQAAVRAGIFDSDIHPTLRNRDALRPYLSKRWNDHLDQYGDPQNGPYAARGAFPRYTPEVSRRDAWPPSGGPPGSDLAFMRLQHLDPNQVEIGVLEPLGMGHATRNLAFGAAVCSALNSWQVAEFVEPEPRLRASVLIAQDDAEAAVAEIERRAGDLSFAQIQMPSLTTDPLGHNRYRPILEAAVHHGFPVGIHVGGATGARTGSGWPSTYNEEHYALSHSMQAQITSLILEGVCEALPSIRFIMIEGGCAWSISLGHRLDRLWERMRAEVPNCIQRPSHYLREHFYFSSQPVEEPENPTDLIGIYETIGWDRMLYASDYPHWDYDDPKYAFKTSIPDDKKRMLMRDNARGLYRLA